MCDLCRTNTVQEILQHSAPTNEPNRIHERTTTMNTTDESKLLFTIDVAAQRTDESGALQRAKEVK